MPNTNDGKILKYFNVADIIKLIVLIVTLVLAYSNLDKRITLNEQDKVYKKEDLEEIKGGLKELNKKFDTLKDKLNEDSKGEK